MTVEVSGQGLQRIVDHVLQRTEFARPASVRSLSCGMRGSSGFCVQGDLFVARSQSGFGQTSYPKVANAATNASSVASRGTSAGQEVSSTGKSKGTFWF